MVKTRLIIDITKPLEDEELYALHKLYFRANDILYTSRLYVSKEQTQYALNRILEFAEKNDIPAKVRWLITKTTINFTRKGVISHE